MNEAGLWRSVKAGLEKASNGEIFLQRHEDKFAPGIPDISYCYRGKSGWIELKYLKNYPMHKTVVNIPHYTPAQKLWAKKYIEKGGNYFLVLRIKNDCFAFIGEHALCWPRVYPNGPRDKKFSPGYDALLKLIFDYSR